MATTGWEYVPEHDAWGKRVTFEATPGRRRNTYDVAVRRERKGSKLWRADLYSMMGWEALTPTQYTNVTDAKKDIDHILAAFSKVRHDPHNDEDIQIVAHYVVNQNRFIPFAYGGTSRDPSSADSKIIVYRGWKIEQEKSATQLGYYTPGRSAVSNRGKGRKISGWLVHYPPEEGHGGAKFVDTLKEAKTYVDNYLGPASGRDPGSRRLTKPEKIALVMSLARGDKAAIGGRIWSRIDDHNFKVHRQSFEPNSAGSDTTWVRRTKTDIASMI